MEVRKRSVKTNRKSKSWSSKPVRNPESTDWMKRSCKFIVAIIFLICNTVLVHRFHSYSQTPKPKLVLADPDFERPPSHSILHKYGKAAVSSDAVVCSGIGRTVLEKNGSAVDAALATLFCCGIVNMEAMGIGGGVIMTVYIRKERKAYSIIARESSPGASHRSMFNGMYAGDFLYQPSRTGGLSVGVPGELKGYWEAWKKFGRLPWKEIVAPSIALCHEGYELSKPQHDALKFRPDVPKSDPNLRSWFIDKDTGDFKRWGSTIFPSKLCETYERIAEEGGLALHDGSLTTVFVEDIQAHGGLLTEEDMQNYTVDWRESLEIPLGDNRLLTAPPPASGALLCHTLQILKGYNITREGFSTTPGTIVNIHRVLEAFKFSFAKRRLLGDPNFVDISNTLDDLLSGLYAEVVRSKIDDISAFSKLQYYGGVVTKLNEHGTNHVSILSSEGDAVAATSSINLYFGAGFTSERTGILLNSVMDDFSIPNVTNYFDFLPSSLNYIEPGKKPISSACPTVIVDKSGRVNLVLGASGGSRIITAVAWVIIRMLWLGEDLKAAIDASRIHHQLTPMMLSYEYGILREVVEGLQKLGHPTERYTVRGSVVSAVSAANGSVFGNADFRKFGGVDGLD